MEGHSLNEEILLLLESKNRCLDRLQEATREFLRHPLEELVLPEEDGEKSALALYEDERTLIIHTLQLHDRRIADLVERLAPESRTEAFLARVRDAMKTHERGIAAVFNADDVVFARIREAQAQITRLVAEGRKSREILSRFKSASPITGEEVDRTL
jgi:hypothetical protein